MLKFNTIKNSQGRLVKSLDFVPKGWKLLKGSWTEPKGYKWYFNGKSLFGGEWQTALIKDIM